MFASEDFVELLGYGGDDFPVIGDDAGLEISSVGGFCSYAGAGEIGTAGVGEFAVDYYRFEVDAGTQNPFHALYQVRIAVKIFSKGRAGLFCVQEPNFDVLFYQVGQYFEKGYHFAAFIDVEVFEVGGSEPKEFFGFRDAATDYLFVNLSVCDKFKHNRRDQKLRRILTTNIIDCTDFLDTD